MRISSIVVVEKKERPFWQIVLSILLGIIFINYLITLCNYLGEKYAGIASVVVLIASIGICTLIIMKLMSHFVYSIEEDTLVFERIIGKKRNIALTLKLDEITSLKPYKEVKKKDKEIALTYKFVCSREHDEYYAGEFERESKKYRFIFKPTEKMIEVINKSLE